MFFFFLLENLVSNDPLIAVDYSFNEQRVFKTSVQKKKENQTVILQDITPTIRNHSLYLLEQPSKIVPQWYIREEDNSS